jgi:hypothetical protein
MSVSNVRPQRSAMDWREVEAEMQDTVVAVIDNALATLDDLEALLGDEEDVGHEARTLAASLRTCRNERTRRAEMLRLVLHELEVEARAST